MFNGGGQFSCIYGNQQIIVLLVALAFIATCYIPGADSQTYIRRTTSVCRVDSECPTNSYCEHYNPPTTFGICSCLQGYFILTLNYSRHCTRFATAIGDYCQHDDQCQYLLSTDSECRVNSCQCQEGTHYVERERRCYKTSYLGQYCRLTNNCIGDYMYCRDGICVCSVGKHPNAGRNLCLPAVHLNEKCFRDEECIVEYSRCNNVCRCRVSYVLNQKQTQCLPIARKLHDVCEEDLQCLHNIPYSRCQVTTENSVSIGKCTCASGYHEIGYKCYNSAYLNGVCEIDENCAINPDTRCIDNRCRCDDHMMEIDGQCSAATRYLLYSFQIFIIITIDYILWF
ncbi:uncharacterized protein DDB_G0272420-like isoform X2 [Wyeomyia smithii]|uniref:uncharacterized protein DDB_G0272420-like isoform X2 n=1 Tax=Wyeomyia smithii TaxID=174621 RepID=UPI002467D7C1|nr:uncharacterized protein DDB_G0272420-like isoform X2 [Wyeomyia smithii]